MTESTTFKSLLVPLDGSPFSECATPWAASLAERMGAEVCLLQVTSPPAYRPGDSAASASETNKSKSRNYLETLAGQMRSSRPIRVRTVVLEHPDPAPAIKEFVEREGIDLVAASTHGKGALGALWFGSVTYEMLATLSRPILLVRPHGSVAGVVAKPVMKRMLVTLDGSERAEKILDPAMTLGRAFGLEYTLLQVIGDIPNGRNGIDDFSPNPVRRDAMNVFQSQSPGPRDQATAYLETVARRLRREGFQAQSLVAADSDAGAAILRTMAEPVFDCIALETQKKKQGPARLVFGSVARRIVHAAAMPILVHSANIEETALSFSGSS